MQNFEKNEMTRTQTSLNEVVAIKTKVEEVTEEFGQKTKAIESMLQRMDADFNQKQDRSRRKQEQLEKDFTGNFTSIKEIVLHADR